MIYDLRPSITVSALIASSIDLVWHQWTSPEHITQWNFASDDWYAPSAINDLQVGGKFSFGMAAKDGSFSFDLEGEYLDIVIHHKITYQLADGRMVWITFESTDEGVLLTETFEPEQENSHELQQAGWQAILNNFKKYVEGQHSDAS